MSISVHPGPEPSPKENSPQPEREKIDAKNIPDKIDAECFTNQQHQSPANILTSSALAANSPNLAAVVRDPRIARKASQAAALVAEKRPLLEIPRTVVQLDMDLCSPDSPEAQEPSQMSPLSLARHGGVSASDLSFITIEDTPSSPGLSTFLKDTDWFHVFFSKLCRSYFQVRKTSTNEVISIVRLSSFLWKRLKLRKNLLLERVTFHRRETRSLCRKRRKRRWMK